MSSVGSDYKLTGSDVNHLVNCLADISDRWHEIGIALQLPGNVREQCRDRRNIISLTNVLTEWVEGNGRKPMTLGYLKTQLASSIVGRGRVADGLILKFNEVLRKDSNLSASGDNGTSPRQERIRQ